MPVRIALIFTVLVGVCATACRRGPESRVRGLEAKIDGLTCPTCVPPLHRSLQAQYGHATIAVDDDRDSATVTFDEKEPFAPAAFKAAVERVRMHVITLRLQACGTVQTADGRKWLTSGDNRFEVRSDQSLPDQPICADGTLDTRSDPAIYHLTAFTVQAP